MTQAQIVRSGRPAVAIVGRPNVGKSTLFNRLVGRRQAIVHDLPGVTRDRLIERCEIADGFEIDLIDTGGLVPDREDEIGLNQQVVAAIEESDAVILVVDGHSGPLPADREILDTLRRSRRPITLAVNKGDTREASFNVHEFHAFGLEPILVSAEHGVGIEELREAIVAQAPHVAAHEEPAGVGVAIVGRPNVGKSSLLNRLVGDERVLVSPTAGTTRDPIDTVLQWRDETYVLVDTAGIRRRSRVSGAAEGLAVMMAHRQIERAALVLLVIDASAGVTSGDLAIAGAAWEAGRGLVLVANKWDLLDDEARDRLEEGVERLTELFAAPSRVNVSALTGRGVDKILPALSALSHRYRFEISTARLNELLERILQRHHVPTISGRPWKVLYASQVSTAPPTIMLFANRKLPRSSTLRRFLENALRSELGLQGVPVRLVIRRRERGKSAS